jgi:hypothetical protein
MIEAVIAKDGSILTKDDIREISFPWISNSDASTEAAQAFIDEWFSMAEDEVLSDNNLMYDYISIREYFLIFTHGYDARGNNG